MKQDTIQDLNAFNEEIFDVIQDYINDAESIESFLNINIKTLKLEVGDAIASDDCDSIQISTLAGIGEDGKLEPNTDATFELASKYIFIR